MGDKEEPQLYRKRYKVDKKLGAGNFGTAYLVTDLKVKNDPKVLKVVRLGEMDSEQAVDSVREAELLAKLDNEHIVKFHESFVENDCLCIVTEFCEGGDLDQRLKELKKQKRTLEEDQVTEWLIQILIAVQYMHKSRILHRDLKARNIFLKSNKIKIGDFGISRILVGTMDVATTFTGTPYYMSPEVMKHDGYEAKSDIWSVACLLYEMCTNEHAFDGKGLMNVIYKVVEGKPPELPKTYSKELNDVCKKMFIKDPKKRPTAAEVLQSPFIIGHRQRTKLMGPLENTISGKLRSQEINARFQNSVNYGQMQSQNWSLASKDYAVDYDNDVEPDEGRMNQLKEESEEEEPQQEEEEEEEEQLTVKPAQTLSPAKQAMIQRKIQEADARAQMIAQATRSHVAEVAQKRQMMRENTSLGTMKQSRPPVDDDDDEREEEYNNRSRNSAQFANEGRANNRGGPGNAPSRGGFDDRPITPLRSSFKQVAERYGDDDDSQYHDNRYNDRSPTRDSERTLTNQRLMSASQRSTMNSMSRTIDPKYAAKPKQPIKNNSPGRTMGSMTRERSTLEDRNSTTLRDNPKNDAYGPVARDMKIHTLRAKAINLLGESTFERVYDYLVKQRTAQKADPNLDEAKIAEGLKSLVQKPSDCFLVDQLVFLELMS
ncbi:unnamed protein product [Adineta steineri]|uniref:non-specific serine/threonine protein kinase n=1 Tax=Adineta steineri TaxID=433720 RepID=A0A819JTF2_9BILA|nr:unnamed protein product [Adineta steineri]CAF3938053.1 unnamed protein product [Adineta steineri]